MNLSLILDFYTKLYNETGYKLISVRLKELAKHEPQSIRTGVSGLVGEGESGCSSIATIPYVGHPIQFIAPKTEVH